MQRGQCLAAEKSFYLRLAGLFLGAKRASGSPASEVALWADIWLRDHENAIKRLQGLAALALITRPILRGAAPRKCFDSICV
jgi:hypothetical protein